MLVRRSRAAAAVAVAAAAALTLGIVVALVSAGDIGPAGQRGVAESTRSATGSQAAATAPTVRPAPVSPAEPGASGDPSGAASDRTTPVSPRPTPPAVALPGLVGAIGDSLTVAVNADGTFAEQPRHSWVLGDAPGDGVESHLERLRALGADPATVMAARSGAAIATAPRQATRVVEAAAGLIDGEFAYVTFELGANDVCAPTLADATDPETFAAAVDEAFRVLADGLRPGSLLVVLSVPDLTRLRAVLEDEPRAQSLHRQYGICPSALGEAVSVDGVVDRTREYNAALIAACEALRGTTLGCRHDLAGDPASSLNGAAFELADLSPLDWFHPSLAGQQRIAQESWRLTPWSAAGQR